MTKPGFLHTLNKKSEKGEERKEYLSQGTQRGMVIGWKLSRELGGEVRPGADSVKGKSQIAESVDTRYVKKGKMTVRPVTAAAESLIRVEPRITSSLLGKNLRIFFCLREQRAGYYAYMDIWRRLGKFV